MAPVGKHLGLEIRQQIIKLNTNGKSVREIAEIVGKGKSTVHDIKRYREEFRLEHKSRQGQGKKISAKEERKILIDVKKNPFKPVKELKIELEERSGVTVCEETVRNVLRKHDFHGRIARNKPFISNKNKKLRIAFAKDYLLKSPEFWNTVLYTDESKFNLNGSDGKSYVWRKPNQEFAIKNTKGTVKHGGGSVMVWGCMSSAGVGNLCFVDGKMDRFGYLNILKENVKQSAEKLGILENFSFCQDNDPKHKSNVVQMWLIHHCPKLLQTPAQSPDLNVIEHLWEELARRVYKNNFNTLAQLKVGLLEAWHSIEPEVCKNLVNSMPRRLQAVIDSGGYPTKY